MPIVSQILSTLSELSNPQRRFFLHLLCLWPCVSGRFNLFNLSRYSSYSERTLRRHFARSFPWAAFNAALLQAQGIEEGELMLAQDASFIRKSGKKTPGLGWFYNGCAQRMEKGLELSLVAAVDLARNTAYALHAQQTLASLESSPGGGKEEVGKEEVGKEEVGKDLKHLQITKPHWPVGVRHLGVDGAYARRSFIDGALELGLCIVSRLRCDANVRFLYEGPPNKRGRPRQYAGKVQWNELDLSRWCYEGELEDGVLLYSAILNCPAFKRNIKVALLIPPAKTAPAPGAKTARRVLLFSTDLELSGRQIVRMYRARFQIEFLFRDAKSGAGLSHCQSRNTTALNNHWNAAFTAINLAKVQTKEKPTCKPIKPIRFSWASLHQKQVNQHLLKLFSSKLDLDWSLVKSHPNFPSLVNYGVINP